MFCLCYCCAALFELCCTLAITRRADGMDGFDTHKVPITSATLNTSTSLHPSLSLYYTSIHPTFSYIVASLPDTLLIYIDPRWPPIHHSKATDEELSLLAR